jgi:carboxylesterase family protein
MYIEQSEESIKRILAVIKLALILWLALADTAQAAIEFADVTGGRLEGEVTDGIASFKGVPFATPPVGVRRWKAPQPVLSWSGTRNANRFAPACVQPRSADQPPISEDCLYLNVWNRGGGGEASRGVAVSLLARTIQRHTHSGRLHVGRMGRSIAAECPGVAERPDSAPAVQTNSCGVGARLSACQ